MLFAAGMPQLVGSQFFGNPAIEEMQTALANAAMVTGYTSYSASVTGVVDVQTLNALGNIVSHLMSKGGLPSAVGTILQVGIPLVTAGLAGEAAKAQLISQVSQYAPQLTKAIKVVGVAQKLAGDTKAPTAAGASTTAGKTSHLITGATPRLPTGKTTSLTSSSGKTYPAGSIAAKVGALYRVAVPKVFAAGFSGAGGGLGADLVEVAPSTTQPSGATVVTPDEFEKQVTPWYKRTSTYLIAGGVLAAGGAGWFFLFRK